MMVLEERSTKKRTKQSKRTITTQVGATRSFEGMTWSRFYPVAQEMEVWVKIPTLHAACHCKVGEEELILLQIGGGEKHHDVMEDEGVNTCKGVVSLGRAQTRKLQYIFWPTEQ